MSIVVGLLVAGLVASAGSPARLAEARPRAFASARLESVAAGGGVQLIGGAVRGSGAAVWRATHGRWHRVAGEAFGDASEITAVAWEGRRFVAADDRGRWWASPDGRAWVRSGQALRGVTVTSAVGWRGQTVVVGDRRGAAGAAATTGVVLAADRLRRWRQLATFRFRDGTISGVAVHRRDLWVTGFDVEGARVWRTRDGRRWRRDIRLPGAAVQGLEDVDGRLLAVGAAIWDPLRPLRWTAADGWRAARFRTGERAREAEVVDVARVRHGALAIGRDGDGAAAWWSPDGERWRVVGR